AMPTATSAGSAVPQANQPSAPAPSTTHGHTTPGGQRTAALDGKTPRASEQQAEHATEKKDTGHERERPAHKAESKRHLPPPAPRPAERARPLPRLPGPPPTTDDAP